MFGLPASSHVRGKKQHTKGTTFGLKARFYLWLGMSALQLSGFDLAKCPCVFVELGPLLSLFEQEKTDGTNTPLKF